jgi:hypothetical protein
MEVDFVPVKAQAIHKDQQGRSFSAENTHSKALRNHEFQKGSIIDLTCFGTDGATFLSILR